VPVDGIMLPQPPEQLVGLAVSERVGGPQIDV
jgi:hypothetical protein